MKLRLGTRGSALALTQSGTIAERLRAAGHEVELVVIRTAGDRSQAPSFGSIGAQGIFVRDIEQALLDEAIDIAVHSFKDLPTASPKALTIAAVPPRADAADVLIAAESACDAGTGGAPRGAAAGGGLPLRRGARVGTSSARRAAWLQHFRPDISPVPLRGNVPTRVQKLRDGGYDAIMLAAAGLARLADRGTALDATLEGLLTTRLDPRRFVPAPAQGALAVQCRADRGGVRGILAALDDPATRAAVTIERDALRRAEAGCNTAFGAYCIPADEGFALIAMLERDGRVLVAEASGKTPERLGADLWRRIEAAA